MGKRGRPPHPDILTPREWEVLALLRLELSNPEIAERLGISRDGAKYHVSQILGKLGLENREQAARWQSEDAQPWWATAFAPFLPGWRKRSSMLGSMAGAATRLIAGVVLAATLGGLGLLGLLLYLQNDDGDEEATEAGETPAASSAQLSYIDEVGTLWLVNANGTRQRFANDDVCASSSLHWSPTGETLACASQGRIELLDGEGQLLGEVELSNDSEFGRFEWSPTGETFLYTVRDEGPFYIVDRTGDLLWQVGPWDQSLSGYGTAPHGLALWSPDGQRLAYRTLDGEMRVFSLATGEETIHGDFRPMGWAKNGSSLIVAINYQPPSSPGGFPSYSVGVLALEGVAFASVKELDNGTQFWISPDGSQVAKVDRRDDGIGLALVSLSGGAATPIPDSRIGYPSDSLRPSQVTFSPDSKRVYWVDANWPAVLYRANTDGTNLERLAEAPALIAVLSPDLSSLAHTVFDDTATLYIMNIDGTGEIEIDSRAPGSGQTFPFAWRPLPR